MGNPSRSKVAMEVREKSDREEGNRRRRRRGEVDWDELPTLIIWENAAEEGCHAVTPPRDGPSWEARPSRIF